MGRVSLSVSVEMQRAARIEVLAEKLDGYKGVSDIHDEALEEWLDNHDPERGDDDGL